MKLYEHQKEALRLIRRNPHFALFMEQGTGKTLVGIKNIERISKLGIRRIVIFAPASLIYNWSLEIDKFMKVPHIVERLSDKNKKKRTEAYKEFLKNDYSLLTLEELKERGYKGRKKDILSKLKGKLMILLVNYEKARVMYKELRKYKPQSVIIDESQNLCNRNAQRSKAIYRLTRTCGHRLLMTGTPICNGYEDLFFQYKIMDESVFGSDYKDFEERYIKKGGYMGYDIVGYKNEDELKEIIKNTSYRIKIDECLELPSMSFKYLTCKLGKSQKLYDSMDRDMIAQLDVVSEEFPRKKLKDILRNKGVIYSPREPYRALLIKSLEFINTSSCDLLITKLIRLQQITGGFLKMDEGNTVNVGREKLVMTKEIVGRSKIPVLIFCQFVPEIELLLSELSNIKGITVKGYRDKRERDKIYSDFTKGDIDVLILQIQSGSVGLNLQQSNRIIFYSWSLRSTDYVQAISRIKRPGQKNHMEVIHLIAEDTIDEETLRSILNKRKLSEKLFE